MGFSSVTWTLPSARKAASEADAGERAVAVALGRCRALGPVSVLFVEPGAADRRALRLAHDSGARVTALCPQENAADAREAGAEFVLDARRTDPTWYRGAWSVIVDPGGRFGFSRAHRALGPHGVYLTVSSSAADRVRSLLSRLAGGPTVQRFER